jgi:hypothetical protein
MALRLKKAQKKFANFVSRSGLHGLTSVIGPGLLHTGLLRRGQIADSVGMGEEKKRIQFLLPAELAEQIDSFAGPGQRSAFIEAVLELEFRRRRLAALKSQQIQAGEAEERRWVN